MKNKEINKIVKKLAKEKKYEEIFQTYGPKYFRKFVSKEYTEKDILKLEKEGKFLDIYNKYGYFPNSAYKMDFENETGKKPNIFQMLKYNPNIKENISYIIKQIFYNVSILILGIPIVKGICSDIEINNNTNKYQNLIQKYHEELDDYSDKINAQKLTDLETIIKVINDMHQNIKGYKITENGTHGYFGMDLMNNRNWRL